MWTTALLSARLKAEKRQKLTTNKNKNPPISTNESIATKQ